MLQPTTAMGAAQTGYVGAQTFGPLGQPGPRVLQPVSRIRNLEVGILKQFSPTEGAGACC